MILKFLQRIDVSIVLLLQDFLSYRDDSACSMICTCMQRRCHEMKHDLIIGRSERQMVIDASRFWKIIDIDFQLKNRNLWNNFAKEVFIAEIKRNLKYTQNSYPF